MPIAAGRSSLADYALHELRLGLVLFFALSGFLLYRPWVTARFEDASPPPLGRYLIARARRILPGYYVALAGSTVLLWGLAGHPGVRLPPPSSLPLFLVFGQNLSTATVMKLDPPMWTLAIEVSFYLALPFFAGAARRLPATRRAQLFVPAALIVAGLVWMLFCHAAGLGMPYTKSLPSALPYFASGMAAAVLSHGRSPTPSARSWLLAGGGALVLADAVAQSVAAAGMIPVGPLGVVRDLPAAIGFAAIISVASTGAAPRTLSRRSIVALGTVSYGIYLWNVPLILVARSAELLPHAALPAAAVAFAASTAMATISWHLVERPAMRHSTRRLPQAAPTLA